MGNPQLNNVLFDLALKQALAELVVEQEKEAAQILKQYSQEPPRLPPQKTRRLIKNLGKKLSKHSKVQKSTAVRLTYRLAISLATLLVVLLSITIAVGASGFDLFSFFFNIHPKYSTVEQVNAMTDRVAAEVRASDYSLPSFYFPQNMPQGYVVEQVFVEGRFCRIVISNEEKSIDFRQNGISTDASYATSFDTEFEKGEQISIDGYKAYYIEEKEHISIGYSTHDAYFRFEFKNMTKAAALKTAGDLKKFLC